MRPGWDEWAMNIAKSVALRADCTRRKVGSIITQENRIIGAGYNGAPSKRPGCLDGHCPRGKLSYEETKEFSDYENGPGKCVAIHAEANALLHVGASARGGTIYITAPPCSACKKLIIASGIDRVVYEDNGETLWIATNYL